MLRKEGIRIARQTIYNHRHAILSMTGALDKPQESGL